MCVSELPNDTVLMSGLWTLFGAIVGGVMAMWGSRQAIRMQLEAQKKSEKDKEESVTGAIAKLLWPEIELNDSLLSWIKGSLINQEQKPGSASWESQNYRFNYETYNTFKFDLIKYKIIIADDVVSFYSILRLLEAKNSSKELTDKEFFKIKELPDLVERIKSHTESQ